MGRGVGEAGTFGKAALWFSKSQQTDDNSVRFQMLTPIYCLRSALRCIGLYCSFGLKSARPLYKWFFISCDNEAPYRPALMGHGGILGSISVPGEMRRSNRSGKVILAEKLAEKLSNNCAVASI